MNDGFEYHDEYCEVDLGSPGCHCERRLNDMPLNTHPKESIALKTPPYVAMYPALTRAAHQCGYALAVHGSMARDMDLIAVPWVQDATTSEELVEALREACGGWIHAPKTNRDPTTKPHGRLGWTIHVVGTLDSAEPAAYIDLSVMEKT